MERTLVFRLPIPGAPRAELVADYASTSARLIVDGDLALRSDSRDALRAGIACQRAGHQLLVRASDDGDFRVLVDGIEAPREDQLRAPPSRSAWWHATIALAGSVFGLVASYLYVLRAGASGDPWALKMATHMAVWHLLLTVTLFPCSVWGQRLGIRAVQAASALFLLIHLGIAIANALDGAVAEGAAIATLNALSGASFLAAVLYGQRAHADMDPLAAFDPGPRARGASSQPPASADALRNVV
jgi:hypothetical protein